MDRDQSAWEEVIRRYGSLVLTVGRQVGLTSADAEDCAQHTWTALLAHRKKIKDPVALPAWLIRTTRRQAVRMLKLQAQQSGVIKEAPEILSAALPDEQLIMLERQAHLELAIRELEPRCRRLLEALFFAPEDRSYQEIAKELGIPMNSLGPTRRRCLEKLRTILQEMGYL